MVQYAERRCDASTDYWKISDPQHLTCAILRDRLEKKGIQHSTRTRKPELVRSYDRVARGLLRFAPCSTVHLVAFCHQRRLQITAVDPTRGDLINALRIADENSTFYHFTDLPPELRAHIFELHFRSFGVLNGPIQPPVTRASRLFREEALPLFYKTCTFAVDVIFSMKLTVRAGQIVRERDISPATASFLNRTCSIDLSTIRKMSLEASNFILAGSRALHRSWLIDYNATGARKVRKGVGWGSSAVVGVREKRVAAMLSQAVEEICESSIDGKSKFERLLTLLRDGTVNFEA